MAMFLMVLCMSLLALAVTFVAFAGATRAQAESAPQPKLKPERALPQHFFADAPVDRPTVPPSVLLAQIEQHIRLEQAAAESFIERPTPASLHGRTTSPFVH
ncbi:MAG TPA: hypothetical protein VJU18_03760 [Vicinamibacteria bacterium]|nr:hypothetical protein [Vicinamibacteria bacterium]